MSIVGTSIDRASFIDRPFAPPLDIIIDVPVPPSINVTHRPRDAGQKPLKAWIKLSGQEVMFSGQLRKARAATIERFEVTIIFDEAICGCDLDNPIKTAIDHLRRLAIIKDDNKKYMRRMVIEWGEAPKGCRLILKPIEGSGK